jgi:hypothetical protein
MAQSIARQEGYGAANSACTAINNPGCLRAGPGQIGTSGQGFAIFPDASTGWSALDSQIQYNISLGLNMNQFFAGEAGVYPGYAPSVDSNNPAQYASNVASWMGVDTTTPLAQLQAAYDNSGGSTSYLIPDLGSDLTVLPDYSSQQTDYTPYLLAAAAVLVLGIMAR